MKTKFIVIVLIILIAVTIVYAANVKWSALTELTAIDDADVLCVIDSGTSKKITVINFFDTIDTFSELNTIVTNKTLVNEEDAAVWDALGTFNLGITITTGDPFTLGANRIDNGSDLIDGEQIANDTIDNDSIDWADMTDLGTDGVVTWGNIAEGELANSTVVTADIKDGEVTLADLAAAAYAKDLVTTAPITGAADNIFVGADSDITIALAVDGVDSVHYAAGSIDYEHLADDVISGAAAIAAFESGDTFLILEAGVGLRKADYDDLPGAGGGMTSFIAEDGDGTEVSISDAEEWKFVEGTGIDINWTDVDPGSDADPFDLTFTVALGTDIAAAEMADADHGDVQWNSGDADVESMDLGDATTGTYYVGLFADDTGISRPIYADAPLSYAQATGTLTAGEFSGGGGSLTGVDAATGDSATDFFDAGALADARVPDNITIDLATLATTLTITDNENTAENNPLVFVAGADPDGGNLGLETDGDAHYNPSTGTITATGFATTVNTKGEPKHMRFNLWNPNSLYDDDTQVCIWPLTDAAITITKIEVTCNADPATELDFDLKWADAFIGLANAAVIDEMNTTSGTTSISAGFDDATVASGKCIYVEFQADPDAAITQVSINVTFDYD